jgi:hypothetical protein
MNTLLFIVAIHAMLIGSGLLLAGIGVIASPTDSEAEALRRGLDAARKRSWWHAQGFILRHYPNRLTALGFLIDRWPERPLGRKFIYYGLGCLLIAVVSFHLRAST